MARTLSELAAQFQARQLAGEPQLALLESLSKVCAKHGLRIAYDEHAFGAAAEAGGDGPGGEDGPGETANVGETDAAAAETGETDAGGGETDAAGGGGAAALPRGLKPFEGDSEGLPPVAVDGDGHIRDHYDDGALLEREVQPGGYFGSVTTGEAAAGRVIVSVPRGRVRSNPPLCAQCNGAVFDAKTWELLVVPPRAPSSRPAAGQTNRALADGKYQIVRIGDGTMVNFYRWSHPTRGPIWCIATRNSNDVSHLRWMGDLTYAEILHNLLGRYPGFVAAAGMTLRRDFLCRGDVRLDFAGLDPATCYSVGFRCHRYHPLLLDPEAVWNVQSTKGGATEFGAGLPGIPAQHVQGPADINRALGRAAGAPVRIGDLEVLGEAGLAVAVGAIAGDAAPRAPAAESAAGPAYSTPFTYGFVLRSADPDVQDVLCDSALLREVRRLVYKRPPGHIHSQLHEGTRLDYHALRAFLSPRDDRALFLSLYPQFADKFREYGVFTENVVRLIGHMRRQKAMAPDAAPVEAAPPTTQTRTIARALLDAIERSRPADFAPFNGDATSIIRDFVCVPDYAMIFLHGIAAP